jgi:N-acyl-D-aspartate/D-glutamate deacylase
MGAEEPYSLAMQHTHDVVIRAGTVIDGSGGPSRRADVAVRDGRITSIGRVDEGGAREVNAEGLVVAPGVVDIHTHYDAQLLWDGAATPSSLHGVTTIIGGNCGFSIAPLVTDQAGYLAAMLARVEGIPLESLRQGVSWDWQSFGDFLSRLEGQLSVNAGFLVGHTTLRRCVMGDDDTHPAAGQQLVRIENLLRASLAEGALGLSSSLALSHNDADGRAVSSRYADRSELVRLARVTGEYEGTTLEFIPTVAAYFDDEDMDLMTAMSIAADRPLNWNVLNVNTLLWDGSRQRLQAGDHAAGRGGRVVALTMPMSSTLRLNFVSGFVLDTLPGWTDLFEMTVPERLTALASPGQRQRMRAGVEHGDSTLVRRLRDWDALIIGETFSSETATFTGRRLGDIAANTRRDAFDSLLDTVVADKLRTVIVVPPVGNDAESWRLRRQVWDDDRAVIGGSDSGAHLDIIDTFLYATSLLGPICRDGHLGLEKAVRLLSDIPARLYGLRGRGRLAPGYQADVIIFDPSTIGPGPVRMRDDLPAGASRLYADAVGIEHVFVNGIETVDHGALTGASSGSVLRSGRDTVTVRPRDPYPAGGW